MSNDASKLAESFQQWKFGATKPRTTLMPKRKFEEFPDRNYSLKNYGAIKYLQHERQTFGINLGWTDDATNATGDRVSRFFVTRQGSEAGPVKYGELLAIGYGSVKPPYIRFEQRTVGINLGWSERPVFEWKILGGAIGQAVHTQDKVALYNTKSEDGEFLIFFDRSLGGDIGWPSSRTYTDRIKDMVGPAAKKAVMAYFGL